MADRIHIHTAGSKLTPGIGNCIVVPANGERSFNMAKHCKNSIAQEREEQEK